jgi:hypothetical protein
MITPKTMRKLKLIPPFSLALFISFNIFAQECVVEHKALKGDYSGDCKKGKASGKGKAIGVDTYEGDFKSGLPDGQGTYTWQNGNTYTGKFSKGLKNGKGILTFKTQGQPDSLVEGFWKQDAYIGRYEKPYMVHSRTGSVRDVEVEYDKDEIWRVKVLVSKTTSPITSPDKIKVNQVQVLKGSYGRSTDLETHMKASEMSLMEVIFPFRAKFNMGSEEIDVELLEPGSYTISIAIN